MGLGPRNGLRPRENEVELEAAEIPAAMDGGDVVEEESEMKREKNGGVNIEGRDGI